MPLASADPDIRLDDQRQLAAGLLERLAREQRAADDYRRTFECEHPQHASAIATTRGDAARAMHNLYYAEPRHPDREHGEDGPLSDGEKAASDRAAALHSAAHIPSDTLDAWAKALRSAQESDDAGDALQAAQARLDVLLKALAHLNAYDEMGSDMVLSEEDRSAINKTPTLVAWSYLNAQIKSLRSVKIPDLERAIADASEPEPNYEALVDEAPSHGADEVRWEAPQPRG